MAYVRWSSDDFQSDVYVYEHVNGGWCTHVAEARYVFNEPLPPPVQGDGVDAFVKRHLLVMKMIDKSTMMPIDLPHAGEIFGDPTPNACAARLEMLRKIGYHVPQFAIDALREKGADCD